MWDMMRGKGSASTKLGKGAYLADLMIHLTDDVLEGEVVRWSLKGSFFVVQCHSTVEIFSTVGHPTTSFTVAHVHTGYGALSYHHASL